MGNVSLTVTGPAMQCVEEIAESMISLRFPHLGKPPTGQECTFWWVTELPPRCLMFDAPISAVRETETVTWNLHSFIFFHRIGSSSRLCDLWPLCCWLPSQEINVYFQLKERFFYLVCCPIWPPLSSSSCGHNRVSHLPEDLLPPLHLSAMTCSTHPFSPQTSATSSASSCLIVTA